MGLFNFLSRKSVSLVTPPADPYQHIGKEMLACCGEMPKKALLYSEVEEGVVSADIFFQSVNHQAIQFRFAPTSLKQYIHEFWQIGEASMEPKSWTVMVFVVDNGKFDVQFSYPKDLSANEELSDRRPRVVAKHFPSMKVDFSNPN